MPSRPEDLLAPEDLATLAAKQYMYEVAQVEGMVHLRIAGFPLPAAYTPNTVELLLRLPANFPLAAPDMFWMFPTVRLVASGAYPTNCAHFESCGTDRQWQRWSRHFTQAWRPGADSLQTFLGAIRQELRKGI